MDVSWRSLGGLLELSWQPLVGLVEVSWKFILMLMLVMLMLIVLMMLRSDDRAADAHVLMFLQSDVVDADVSGANDVCGVLVNCSGS